MDAPSDDSHAILECTSEPGVLLSVKSGDVIGREGNVDLTKLKDAEYMSRKHARFGTKHGKWFVENLSTKSFTYVNGKQVDPNTQQQIEPGDRLTFGIIRCTFKKG
jgi:predicted component of type VI protein secretion system